MSILDEQRPIVPEWRRCVGAEQREVGTATEKMRDALRAAEKRELEALAELDEATAEIERLRWGNEMACENTSVASCDCPGFMVARDRAERNITGPEAVAAVAYAQARDDYSSACTTFDAAKAAYDDAFAAFDNACDAFAAHKAAKLRGES